MPIMFAAAGTALSGFAEGAILAANIYAISLGGANMLRHKR